MNHVVPRLLLAMTLAVTGCAGKQEGEPDPQRQALIDASLREFCAMQVQLPCRENVAITLRVNEAGTTKTYEFELLPPPLQHGYLSILPGETLYLTGEFRDGLLVNTMAARRRFKAPHLALSFEQRDGGQDMLLTVESSFEHAVKYKLVMMRTDNEQLFRTSSCPVPANGSGHESWPHAIFQLIVLEVVALAPGDSFSCEW